MSLPNDAWGRTVTLSTDGTTDTYTVGPDVDVGDNPFDLQFPAGTDLNGQVYRAINGRPPAGTGGTPVNSDLFPEPAFVGSGTTQDRPQTGDGPPADNGIFLGQYFFDTTLGKPVFFVGDGPTGWVDAMGNPV